MSDDILVVKDLQKRFIVGYHDLRRRRPIAVRAVDGVSFTMHPGETLGLVGESGSGKSTIAYITVGMYQPTSGQMYFRGHDLFAKPNRPLALKKEIQIVFQDPGSSLNPRRTISQILELPLRIHQPGGDLMRQALSLLDMVELPPEYMHKHPHMLSGGEKQMLAVARALAANPSLVLLDEPTSALDVSVQGKVINLLIRLQRQLGLTYLFITHDLSLMRNVASRVAILYLGKMCEIAEAGEFFKNPLHPYTQMLLSSIPVVSVEEEAARPKKVISTGEIPSPVNIPPGCSFHTRCPYITDICKEIDPQFVEAADGHMVRCHLFASSAS